MSPPLGLPGLAAGASPPGTLCSRSPPSSRCRVGSSPLGARVLPIQDPRCYELPPPHAAHPPRLPPARPAPRLPPSRRRHRHLLLLPRSHPLVSHAGSTQQRRRLAPPTSSGTRSHALPSADRPPWCRRAHAPLLGWPPLLRSCRLPRSLSLYSLVCRGVGAPDRRDR